jgi:PHD/YefM family antitoxin component YafN of YafNO toxin-antitoxin module
MNEILIHGKHQTEWITVSKDEYESMRNTLDILSDKDLMEQIRKSNKKGVKSRDFEEVARELDL